MLGWLVGKVHFCWKGFKVEKKKHQIWWRKKQQLGMIMVYLLRKILSEKEFYSEYAQRNLNYPKLLNPLAWSYANQKNPGEKTWHWISIPLPSISLCKLRRCACSFLEVFLGPSGIMRDPILRGISSNQRIMFRKIRWRLMVEIRDSPVDMVNIPWYTGFYIVLYMCIIYIPGG